MRRRSVYTPSALIKNAAEKCDCGENDINWWSWPQTFSSTAGPHGGIGGQALTTFQVFGFEGNGRRFLFCDGLWKMWTRAEMRW